MGMAMSVEPRSPAPPTRSGSLLVVVAAGWCLALAWVVVSAVVLPRLATDAAAAGQVVPSDWAVPATALAVALVGGLVLLRDRTQPYGWLLFVTGILKAAEAGTGAWGMHALVASGHDVPFGTGAAWLHDVLTWPGMALVALLLPGLFPDGRPVAGRWGAALRVTAGSWIAWAVVFTLTARPLEGWFSGLPEAPANPTGILPLPIDPLQGWWLLTMVASLVVSLGSLVVRWRGADTELRQRMKWPLLGFSLVAVTGLAGIANTAIVEVVGIDLGLAGVVELGNAVATLVFAVTLGFGVLRFRLWDVDRVINRTVVSALLTVVVVTVYVVGVVGIGRLVPTASDQGLALGTTVVVALAFDPLRRRVRAGVNRWLFGQRDDPYVLLSHLGGLMAEAGTPAELLHSVVDTVADSLRLPWVAIELDQHEGAAVRFVHGDDEPSVPPAALPLVHRDELVGHLLVAPRSSHEPLGAADRRILADVAHRAGAVAASARLTEDLQRARTELVTAREAERRRIRRDLHDGLGPTLAAQTLALDAAADRVREDPATARDLVAGLQRETGHLVDEIRHLVDELRPPALDELGLTGALVAQVASLDATGEVAVRIRSAPDPLPDLPAAVEVAAWRITREALTNALRHARAASCTITLAAGAETLEVRIVDDGVGLPVVPRAGVGLTSMRERAEELGGTFHAADRADGGTEVVAVLPIGSTPWDVDGTRVPSPQRTEVAR